MKHQDVIERFRKAYQEAYTGILRPEVLEGGNKWFEDFIVQEIDQAIREERERVSGELESKRTRDNLADDETNEWSVSWDDVLEALTPKD